MEFTTLATSSLNLDLFDTTSNQAVDHTFEKGEVEHHQPELIIYTQEALSDLREHCSGIVEKGDDATEDEIDSLHKALEEVQSLSKGSIADDGVVVTVYYKAKK